MSRFHRAGGIYDTSLTKLLILNEPEQDSSAPKHQIPLKPAVNKLLP